MSGELLERAAELARLDAELARVCAGAARTVLVTGPAGIGKTSLVRAFTARLPAGVLVLRAHCDDLEREFGYGVARQLFEPVLAGAEPCHGPARAALTGIAEGGRDPFAVAHGLCAFTRTVLGRARAAVLVVDDAQFADEASLRWLAHLRGRHPRLRLLQLLLRPGGPESGCTHLPLGPLSESAIATLTGTEPATCHRLTGGNPLLAGLLRRALAQDPARRLSGFGGQVFGRSLLDWLSGFPPEVWRFAEALAVLGEAADPGLPAALSTMDIEQAGRCAAELRATGLLADNALSWSHPVLREAVYAGVCGPRRQELHGAAARLLTAVGAPVEQIAAHLLRLSPAGQDWPVWTLRAAADQATQRGAPEAAAHYLRRALAEPPPAADRLDLVVALGLAESVAQPAAGARHLAQALEQLTDPARQRAVAEVLGDDLVRESRLDEAVRVLARTADRLRPVDREAALALDARRLTWGVLDESTAAEAGAEVNRLRHNVLGDSEGERTLLGALAFASALFGGPATPAAALARRALAASARPLAGVAAAAPVWVLLWSGRNTLARKHIDAAIDRAEQSGSVFDQAIMLSLRAAHAAADGELRETIRTARATFDLLPAEVSGFPHLVPLGLLAEALVDRDRPEQALRLLDTVVSTPALESSYLWNSFLLARGRARLASGDLDGGLADLLSCGERQSRLGHRNPAAPDWRSWAARAHLRREQPHLAGELAEQAHELAAEWGTGLALGIAKRTLGLVTGGSRGLDLLQDSAALLRPTTARLDLARTLLDLGKARQAAGQCRLAREALAEARAVAFACGACGLAASARRRLGAAAAPRPATGPGALTDRESRVAALAAHGCTNRDIATRLGLTERTVEGHLSATYRKLGITGRAELRA
ncbi:MULTISPECIES: AAA family ATPase [unclassified Crossiella]|uniref:AAA family ATPase n=1 Tax=unclassified Crossiella TaxID=2620835 RepID=UPI0024943734|nr:MULTISPECIES: LuxR family transcriptional regulator [unclassified Crossiella]